MGHQKFKEFKHLTLNHNDLGLIACAKTILHSKNNKLFSRLRLSLDAVNFRTMGMLNDTEKAMFLDGGAVMYHLMTNPDFLKDCENIYDFKLKEDEKTDCVVCGSSYPNLKQDSDTCYECRSKYE